MPCTCLQEEQEHWRTALDKLQAPSTQLSATDLQQQLVQLYEQLLSLQDPLPALNHAAVLAAKSAGGFLGTHTPNPAAFSTVPEHMLCGSYYSTASNLLLLLSSCLGKRLLLQPLLKAFAAAAVCSGAPQHQHTAGVCLQSCCCNHSCISCS